MFDLSTTALAQSNAYNTLTTETGVARSASTGDSALEQEKHFVLDTNVLLHDPLAIFQFDEHTLYLPLVVLEELDKHKKGFTDLARNARQVSRSLDALLHKGDLSSGFELSSYPGSRASGKLFIVNSSNVQPGLAATLADNQILGVAQSLNARGLNAVLVSNDINLRVKALAVGIPAQGYSSDRVLNDEDVLPTGILEIDETFWESHQAGLASMPFWQDKNHWFARVTIPLALNSFVAETTADSKRRAWRVVARSATQSVLRMIHPAQGGGSLLEARNLEQAMALDLLNDQDLDLVCLLGVAGTGKTLLTMASALAQVRDQRYKEILVTRATVSMGEEIGFLPGTEQEKMNPWLGGTLRDVYSALKLHDNDPIKDKVEIASMSFMRGRSFHDKFILIDEAQNLTVPQIKALLTRAANGSKVVLTGNLGQIDTPYLDQGNSGLAWAVTQTLDWNHSAHLILPRGERSRLATYIEQCSAYRS